MKKSRILEALWLLHILKVLVHCVNMCTLEEREYAFPFSTETTSEDLLIRLHPLNLIVTLDYTGHRLGSVNADGPQNFKTQILNTVSGQRLFGYTVSLGCLAAGFEILWVG